MNAVALTAVQDTREPVRAWSFGPNVKVVRATLRAGDYSLLGFETRLAIERKSLPDLVQSVTRERERFFRELERLRSYEFAAVIVEASVDSLLAGAYVSKATPWSVLASALAITHDFRIPVLFAADSATAARCCYWLLRRFLESVDERAAKANVELDADLIAGHAWVIDALRAKATDEWLYDARKASAYEDAADRVEELLRERQTARATPRAPDKDQGAA